jgi:hypothetical protein
MPSAALIAIAKDEAADIFEWALFHHLIGFRKIVVYDNGSSDRTLAELSRAARFCDVQAICWPGLGQQLPVYQDAIDRFGPQFDALCILDIDEFLFLYTHQKVGHLLAANPAPAIGVSWRMFGSAGHFQRPAGLVLDNYRMCAPDDLSANRHIKSLFRTRGLAAMPRISTAHCITGSYADVTGEPIAWIEGREDGGKANRVHAPDVARVHHYHTKSAEDYLLKLRRGDVTSRKPQHQLRANAFAHNDRNDIAAPPFSHFHTKVIHRIKQADAASRG